MKHYIIIDENRNIIDGFSNAFRQPKGIEICIYEDGGRKFELLGKENPPLTDGNNISLYKYTDKVEKRTQEEMQADLDIINAIPKPLTENEKLWDSVTYLMNSGY